MQKRFGAPEQRQCEYVAVDIDIKDLYDLNWEHWVNGMKMKNIHMEDPNYYIYGILGGIVHLKLNAENLRRVKEFVEKQEKTRFTEGFLAWYDIVNGGTNEKYNVARAPTIPYFTLNEERIAKTIDVELADENCIFSNTTFDDIRQKFKENALTALKKNDKESLRLAHNQITSYILNHIIKVRCREHIFSYQKVQTERRMPDGEIRTFEKLCNEIHFIVTHEIIANGKVKQTQKCISTLPMLTDGKRFSTWSIENILMRGEVIGLMKTELIKN